MGATQPGMEGMLDNMVREFIRVQDVNKDGKISPGEFAKPTHKAGHDELWSILKDALKNKMYKI